MHQPNAACGWSPADMAQEIRKRLTAIARSRSFVDWHRRKALVTDLETQRQAIAQVAKVDAAEALDLLWRFMALANSIFNRCDDSSGSVIAAFQAVPLQVLTSVTGRPDKNRGYAAAPNRVAMKSR
jgi:hypothetical protein